MHHPFISRKFVLTTYFLFAATLSLFAQENTIHYDSTFLAPPKTSSLLKDYRIAQPSLTNSLMMPDVVPPSFKLRTAPGLKSYIFKDMDNDFTPKLISRDNSTFLRGEYSVSGPIAVFGNSAFYGMGEQRNIIGLGAMNYGAVGFTHLFGDKLLLDVNMNVMKYNVPHLTNMLFGASGRMSYQLTDNLTMNVFGGYSRTTNLASYHYGASFAYDLTDHFGVEMGVNRYYDPMTNKWRTLPVFAPYYKLNKSVFGIDLGGLLMDIYDSQRKSKMGPMNPTKIQGQRSGVSQETLNRWGERRLPGMR